MVPELPSGPQPVEKVSDQGLILPPDRSGNIRETIKFEHTQPADTYNSPGVDFENPYNAFAQAKPEASSEELTDVEDQPQTPENEARTTQVLEQVVADLESQTAKNQALEAKIAELEARLDEVTKSGKEVELFEQKVEPSKELADDQPRRVRQVEGVNEKLVKYADGSFEWVAVEESSTQEESAEEAPVESDTEVAQAEAVVDALKAIEAAPTAPIDSTGEQEPPVDEPESLDEEPVEKESTELGIQVGDRVQYRDKDGNIIEGTVQSIIELDNEDYAIYAIENADGSIKNVSYADILTDEPAPGEGNEGDGKDTEGEPGDNGEGEGNQAELPTELETRLQEAQDKYAEATAKHRNGFMGHLLHDSKFIARIPLIGKVIKAAADRLNDAQDKVLLGPARAEYSQALVAIQNEIRERIIAESGDGPESIEAIRMAASDAAIQSEVNLEMKIAASRMERSGKTNRFVNWWVRQNGLGGKFMKAGILVGAGLTAGAILGLAGAPLVLGGAVGAGMGAGVGVYVTKKRASAITTKGGTQTLAESQAKQDLDRKVEYKGQQMAAEGGFTNVADLVSMTEDRTGREKVGNRARVKSASAAGALGGAAGASIGSAIRAGIDNAANVPTSRGSSEVLAKPVGPEITQYDNISILDNEGGTQAIERLYGATPDQARAIWDQVFSQFGTNPLDHSSVGGGMMPDIMDVGGGNFGWSHEGWLSDAMKNALNAAAQKVMGA